MDLSIQAWSGFLSDWSCPAEPLEGKSVPALNWVPANARRRLSSYTKIAFFVADHVRDVVASETIFASRHGDLAKTLLQLQNVVLSEPLSPTQFALSVHNAVSGQFGIVTENQKPSTTISAGINTFDASLLAAYARLSTNETIENVIVVIADETAPFIYQESSLPAEPTAALALRIGRVSKTNANSQAVLSIEQCTPVHEKQYASNMYKVLDFFRYQQSGLVYAASGYHWNWTRDSLGGVA